jgi:hypothetical protein
MTFGRLTVHFVPIIALVSTYFRKSRPEPARIFAKSKLKNGYAALPVQAVPVPVPGEQALAFASESIAHVQRLLRRIPQGN